MDTRRVELLRRVYAKSRMIGWDFSILGEQLSADDPWWDFEGDCRHTMSRATRVLDIGTGGGERLIRLLEALPDFDGALTATVGWEPNIPIARSALEPYGVQVIQYDSERDDRIPCDDGAFDLVMCRHEGINAHEISRVLSSGGTLLTQQVDGGDAPELHQWFSAGFMYPEVTSNNYVRDLQDAGLRIDTVNDWQGTMEFASLEALVAYMALVPWDVPHFSVDQHVDRLAQLEAKCPIKVTQRRFRIYATKPIKSASQPIRLSPPSPR